MFNKDEVARDKFVINMKNTYCKQYCKKKNCDYNRKMTLATTDKTIELYNAIKILTCVFDFNNLPAKIVDLFYILNRNLQNE